MTSDMSTHEVDLRDAAIVRLRKKREFVQHVTAFVVINLALTAIWLLTTPGGFFWPMFPLLIWGIGVVFHGIDTYSSTSPSEESIQREMRRIAKG